MMLLLVLSTCPDLCCCCCCTISSSSSSSSSPLTPIDAQDDHHKRRNKDDNASVSPQQNREEEEEPLLALHVNPQLAWVLNQPEDHYLPQRLSEMLKEGIAIWKPGVRTGSHQCLGPNHVLRNCPTRRMEAKFHFVELFAGIGGFRVALDDLGGQCVMASEVDALARETYSTNFGELPCGDLTEIEAADIPPHDFLSAGFPCQAFTITGRQPGLADPNGNLFFEVVRVLRSSQPKVFLLENVPALATIDDGKVLKIILEELTKSGYICEYKVLRSHAYVPQKRRRIYFVGIRKDLVDDTTTTTTAAASPPSLQFDWPEELLLASEGGMHATDPRANFPPVREILECDVDESYWLLQSQWEAIVEKERKRGGEDAVSQRIVDPNSQARTVISSYKRSHETQSQYVPSSFSNKRIRQRRQQPSDDESSSSSISSVASSLPSLSPLLLPPAPRFFTEREIARLQGFPDNFRLLDACSSPKRLYHQLGNAVCPPVVRAIAERLLRRVDIHVKK
mmetsp:Transcript_43283/g.71923  ORF Transcript_43283/g.71923 Transcript_43283/m.71923 type:complete len:509 (-) Transcript_43283:60-1586(-)